MKTIIILIGVAVAFHPLHASPQDGDALAIEGRVLSVHCFALNRELDARIEEIRSARNYRLSSGRNLDGFSVELELKDKRLYLTKLSIDARTEDYKGGRQSISLSADGQSKPIFADWFSGELVDYHGDHPGYALVMSMMRIMTFEKGVLVKTRDKPVKKSGRGEQGRTVTDNVLQPWIVGDPTNAKAETAHALRQESAADYVPIYWTGGKLGIGVGRAMKDRRINEGKEIFYPTLFELDDLEVFFDDQKHKSSIVVLIANHVHTKDELRLLVIRLRDFFVARGYANVVVQQIYGRGKERRICLEHPFEPGAEQAGARQPATAVDSKSKGNKEPKPESKGRSR